MGYEVDYLQILRFQSTGSAPGHVLLLAPGDRGLSEIVEKVSRGLAMAGRQGEMSRVGGTHLPTALEGSSRGRVPPKKRDSENG